MQFSELKRREVITLLGGAAATAMWSRGASAQRTGRIPTIGMLWHAASAEEEGPYFAAMIEGFRALGYVDGRNIKFEHRFPNEMPERFRSMAADLVSLKVDVLVSVGNAAAPYANTATATIPIVFTLVADPIESKLVASFPRPGGNATGLSTFAADLVGRRLQVLKEMIPGLSRVAQLVNPNAQASRMNVEMMRAAAANLGLTVRTFEARAVDEFEPAFEAIAQAGMQAVAVSQGEGLPFQGRYIIAKLPIAHRIALCAFSRETFEPGALMAYGTDQPAIVRRAAVYVDKILKGAKPAELPVEGPTKFELLVNAKTARAIGIELSPTMLARADEVIE
jgi:putative ABC transport system substrate-binding protein